MADIGERRLSIEVELGERLDTRRASVSAESYNPENEVFHSPVFEKSVQDIEKLSKEVEDIMLFRALDTDHVKDIVKAMAKVVVKPGEVIFRQGEFGDFFYVIQKGTFEEYTLTEGQKKNMKLYKDQGHFGELALMYQVPRSVTVVSLTDGILWALDRSTFSKSVKSRSFKRRETFRNLFKSIPILTCLNTTEMEKLSDALESKTFNLGEVIIGKRDSACGILFIESGEVLIKDDESPDSPYKCLKSGDYFGEMSVQEKRPVTVEAAGMVRVAFLTVDMFERLLGPCDDIIKRNANIVCNVQQNKALAT